MGTMVLDAAALPDDPATLRTMLLAEHARRIAAEEKAARETTVRVTAEVARDAALARVVHLDSHIALLNRNRFGPRSEKLDPDQLQLAIEAFEQERAETQAPIDAATPRRPRACGPRASAIAGIFRPICRASSASWISPRRPARAAGANCIGSARTWPSGWTWCPRSSG